MIKLLYVINYMNAGGPSKVLLNIAQNIDKEKYAIYLLTLVDRNDPEVMETLQKEMIEIIHLDAKKSVLSLLAVHKRLMNEIKRLTPDIIHTHGIVGTIFLAGTKGYRKITTIHNCMMEDYSHTYGKIRGRIFAELHIAALKNFDKVICCSKTSWKALINRVEHASYIRNGSRAPLFECSCCKQIRNDLNIPETAIIFTYVGVLTRRKRVLELISLFEKNREDNEYLLIIGDGPLWDECIKKSSRHIKMLGYQKEIGNYMMISDIYLSNSSSEGFPIAVVEALSCGIPCLLSDIPAHRECFEINKDYYIGELFVESEFGNQKRRLVKRLKNCDRQQIAEFYIQYLSEEIMSKQYEKQYEEVINEN